MHMRTEECLPSEDACLDINLITYMHWVPAGNLAPENTICTRLSMLEPSLPISAIQDIINQTTCHAALVSGELHFPDCHGIVLQVIAASCKSHSFCKPVWCMQMQHSCCFRHSCWHMMRQDSSLNSLADVMQVSTKDHDTSYWFEQHRPGDTSAMGVAGAVNLPNPHVPPETLHPFFKPASIRFS